MSDLADFLTTDSGVGIATEDDLLDSHEVVASVSMFVDVKSRLGCLGTTIADRDAFLANTSEQEQNMIFGLFKHDMLVKAIRSGAFTTASPTDSVH